MWKPPRAQATPINTPGVAQKYLGSSLTAAQGLPTFEKNFYVEHPSVAARSDAEVDEYRQKHQVRGAECGSALRGYQACMRDGDLTRCKRGSWHKEQGASAFYQRSMCLMCLLDGHAAGTAALPAAHARLRRVFGLGMKAQDEVQCFWCRLQMLVQGEGVPKPITTFDEASFPAYVLSEVVRAGFTQPTPIQAQVGRETVRPGLPLATACQRLCRA